MSPQLTHCLDSLQVAGKAFDFQRYGQLRTEAKELLVGEVPAQHRHLVIQLLEDME